MIQFRGLSNGVHLFEFEIDERFFETFEHSEVKEGDISLKLELEKEDRMITLWFNLSGIVKTVCDRCLDELVIPIATNDRLFLKFGMAREEVSEEVIIIPETSYEINISQFIYEFINLSLPYSKIHPDDEEGFTTCNAQMMERMQPERGSDTTGWEALMKLKDNFKK